MVIASALVFILAALLMAGLLAGLAAVLRGMRGPLVDDHPYCRQCGFDLSGHAFRPRRCPECGTGLVGANLVVIGRRRRQPGLVVGGFVLIAVSLWPMFGVSRPQNTPPAATMTSAPSMPVIRTMASLRLAGRSATAASNPVPGGVAAGTMPESHEARGDDVVPISGLTLSAADRGSQPVFCRPLAIDAQTRVCTNHRPVAGLAGPAGQKSRRSGRRIGTSWSPVLNGRWTCRELQRAPGDSGRAGGFHRICSWGAVADRRWAASRCPPQPIGSLKRDGNRVDNRFIP